MELLPQRIPETSIPESLGGTLKVDHLAWLNNCLTSYAETLAESSSLNGGVNRPVHVKHDNRDLSRVNSSAFGQDVGLRNEGAMTVMEFMEHMMKLTRRGIQNEFANLKRLAGSGNFQSTRQVLHVAFNPLSSDIKIHILLTVLHIFLMVIVRRICLNIKTSHPW